MTTKLTTSNLSADTLAAISGPRISNVKIADSSYNLIDDTAANISGGFIIINGQNFISNCQVLIDNTPATTVTFVSNSVIRAQVPASAEGTTKSIYVVNPDGSSAIIINGLTYSAFPAWSTGSTLTSFEALVPVSIQLSAPSATVYTLAAANTLPSSLSLYANGLIAGTVAANTTTNYNFTVNAKDAENQDTNRNFTLPITQNVEPAWTTTANLGTVFIDASYSTTLVATDLSNVTYSVAAGSSLPSSLTLNANGLLSGNVSSANTYSFGIVATDTGNLSNTRTFTISIVGPDVYSPYNTLLLNGKGDANASTNGANTTVFIDSSGNNYTITRIGNTNQGTFSPYSITGWSNYFDGSAYLTVPSNAAFAFGTGAYTIEAWVYIPTLTTYRTIVEVGTSTGPKITVMADGALRIWNGQSDFVTTSTGIITRNTWYHIAWVRESTSLGKLYVNGTSVLTVTSGGVITTDVTGTPGVSIGFYTGYSHGMLGYISNLRIVKGTAVYTSTFAPSTTPLTAMANTSLLTCQSNRLIDNSPNSFTLTRAGGTVTVQVFEPFIDTIFYTPSLHGGSAYFDGTGDYLTVSGTTVGFGTAAYTIEFWIYRTAASGARLFERGTGGFDFSMDLSSAGVLTINNNAVIAGSTCSTSILINTWTHVALVRTSTSASGTAWYINGVASGTFTHSTNIASSGTLSITTGGLLGYLSNMRIVNGAAVYTTAFTPPTSPLTAIANTSLLANFTNAGIIDQTGNNNLETVGGTQLSTAVKNYNNASIYFDGTGDYITTPAKDSLSFGTGDFTVEAWVNFASIASDRGILGSSGTGGYDFVWRTSNGFNIGRVNTSFDNSFAFTPTAGQWYHIAYSRSGTSLRVFVNGTQVGTTATNSIAYNSGTAGSVVGGSTTADRLMNGYIDDLRITKGYARYTSNFTPPTALV